MIVGFDNETFLIRPAVQAPPPVCLSYAEIVQPSAAADGWHIGRAGVLPYNYPTRGGGAALDALEAWLEPSAGVTLVGANTAFDAMTSIVGAFYRSRAFGRKLFANFVRAYEENRVTDVFLRQKLLDLASGCYRFEETHHGIWINHGYDLEDLAWRLAKRRLDKPEPGKEAEHWRLRYAELDGVAVENYPAAAYAYSLEDAVATAEVYLWQEVGDKGGRRDPRIAQYFPGCDPLRDEFNQVRAALPLKDTSAFGLRTHAESVEIFSEQVAEERSQVCEELIEAGLVRREWHQKTEAIEAYIHARGFSGHFTTTAKGGMSKPASALLATGDPLLALVAGWQEISATLHRGPGAKERKREATLPLEGPGGARERVARLISAGLVEVTEHKNTKLASERLYKAYADPRALDPESTDPVRVVPRTPSWKPWNPEKQKGDPTHVPGSLECVSTDSDACERSGDPILQSYAEFTSLAKVLGTDVPILRRGAHEPIHPRFDECLETGRTAQSKPNCQNVRRLPGIRECFVPRPGYVFSDADYPSLELHTLAQVCYWVLGYSTLGEALRAGKDAHLMIACTILRRAYNDLKKNKKDPVVSNARTAGKGVNFGAPGGLGKKKFALYAWKSYRISMTEEEAGALIQQYKDTWTEMPEYFRWVNSLKGGEFRIDKSSGKRIKGVIDEADVGTAGFYNVVQPWSGRLRARATYCAACNSPFQGLGADVAKLAGWLLFKACHGLSELGEADPLYGCRLAHFVHDQWMIEVPEERAHAASMRHAELMDLAGRIVLPDVTRPMPLTPEQIAAGEKQFVPMAVEPMLTRQWSKKAETWTDGDLAAGGRLIPWDMRKACENDVRAWLKLTPEQQTEKTAKREKGVPIVGTGFAGTDAGSVYRYLTESEWPRHVARETVNDMKLEGSALGASAERRAA